MTSANGMTIQSKLDFILGIRSFPFIGVVFGMSGWLAFVKNNYCNVKLKAIPNRKG